ncbi:MAG: ATP-binding protein [Kiritimatiellaeota bacterium]|nr:ATP-binding protein [Kiritimatiellota bacterium]
MPPPSAIVLLVTMLLNALIGLGVYWSNLQRAQNRQFFLFTLCLSLWGFMVASVASTASAGVAEMLIRLASSFSAFAPIFFHLLCLSVMDPESGARALWAKAAKTVLAAVVIALLCFSRFFMKAVRMAPAPAWPEAIYGPGFILFALYFPVVFGMIIYSFWKNLRQAQGAQRVELQFILLGVSAMVPVGVLLNLAIPLIIGQSSTQMFGPLSILVMNSIIAYGIATRRLLGVAYFLRRITAYTLLSGYLIALYLVIYGVAEMLRRQLTDAASLLPHLLATLVTTFSLAPMHGRMQQFAQRLFISLAPTDPAQTLQHARAILQSVTTLDDLLKRFAQMVSAFVGTDRVVLLLAGGGGFVQAYPAPETAPLTAWQPHDALPQVLLTRQDPVVLDDIARLPPTPSLQHAARQLQQMECVAAASVKTKGALEAILLLGRRLSGRIYNSVDQDALQLLCDQLAVALENARLYTQVQDGKIYNEILLDRLVSGVIAVDAAGLVSVFNREAQRVTRLPAEAVLHQPCQALPPPLARALTALLERNAPLSNTELVLSHKEDTVTIRAGGALFKGHAGKTLGALLVFSDISDLKKMEIQVRRSDRLSSLGTLAAGMAHEIKNPLVTLKTFSQLLPERYGDRDFRDTFSTLVGQEIQRIDSIVNQLLEFSRPAKPKLDPVALHQVLDHSLKLVAEELRKKNISLISFLSAPRDLILADSNQLSQVFLNLFLNAIESMSGGGQLTVATTATRLGGPALNGSPAGLSGEQIHISIADTGCGIAPQHVARIFDPFFTTKSEGTGLGLSVVHGIIEEHGGLIDVRSMVAQGTTFHIFFPLVSEMVMNAESTHESAAPMPAV